MLTDLQRIEHMLDVAEQLVKMASATTEEEYTVSVEKQFALKFGFVMLGEDAAQISEDVKMRFPDFPWRVMRGMRNIVVHDYCKTDEAVIWETAVGDMTALLEKLTEMIKALGSGDSGELPR